MGYKIPIPEVLELEPCSAQLAVPDAAQLLTHVPVHIAWGCFCVGSPGRSACVQLSVDEQGCSRVCAQGWTISRPFERPWLMN